MKEESTRIAFAGDFCPTAHLYDLLEQGCNGKDILGAAGMLLESADFSVVNLEYPLTRNETKIKKYGSHQKGAPETARVLSDVGVGLASLANNHVLDYGEVGLQDTIDALEANNVDHVGAGLSSGAINYPCLKTINGIDFAFIAVCENEYSTARGKQVGARGLDSSVFSDVVRWSKDYRVIVLIHGGAEFSHFPRPEYMRMCRAMVDCGASAVVCHHPHYIQGYETYHNAPIIYSLGKLYYSKMSDPHILEIPIATLTFDSRENVCVEFEFFKLSLKTMKIENLDKDQKVALIDRFRDYCKALSSPERIQDEWNSYCDNKQVAYFSLLIGMPTILHRVIRRLHLQWVLRKIAEWRLGYNIGMINLFRCETHNDIMQTILGKYYGSVDN